jgi:hypothetical protein
LKRLIAYRAEIFVADPNGNIPLWANDSGYDSAGLDYLIKTSKQYYDRCRQERTLKKGDRVALRRVGIAVVEQVDDKDLQVVLRKKYALQDSPQPCSLGPAEHALGGEPLAAFLKPMYRPCQRIELVQRRDGLAAGESQKTN